MLAPKTLQDNLELAEFVELVRAEGVTSYLEIGSKYGGSLWHVTNAMAKGSRAVSVDWPNADKLLKESLPSLKACVTELKARGYRTDLIIGDSTSQAVVDRVRAFAPFDLCLIDGGHDEVTVRADWANYGSLARIVAFHDICYPIGKPNFVGTWCHVGKVWKELKSRHQNREIIYRGDEVGIGVLWN